MSRLVIKVALRIAVAASVVAASAIAYAETRSTSASIGRAVPFSDGGCLSSWYTSLTNTCAYDVSLDIPLPAEVGGPVTSDMQVSVFGATSSNNVGCIQVALSKTMGGLRTSGSRAYMSTFGSNTTIALTNIDVWSRGVYYVNCWLDNGARVNSVSYIYTP